MKTVQGVIGVCIEEGCFLRALTALQKSYTPVVPYCPDNPALMAKQAVVESQKWIKETLVELQLGAPEWFENHKITTRSIFPEKGETK